MDLGLQGRGSLALFISAHILLRYPSGPGCTGAELASEWEMGNGWQAIFVDHALLARLGSDGRGSAKHFPWFYFPYLLIYLFADLFADVTGGGWDTGQCKSWVYPSSVSHDSGNI